MSGSAGEKQLVGAAGHFFAARLHHREAPLAREIVSATSAGLGSMVCGGRTIPRAKSDDAGAMPARARRYADFLWSRVSDRDSEAGGRTAAGASHRADVSSSRRPMAARRASLGES